MHKPLLRAPSQPQRHKVLLVLVPLHYIVNVGNTELLVIAVELKPK